MSRCGSRKPRCRIVVSFREQGRRQVIELGLKGCVTGLEVHDLGLDTLLDIERIEAGEGRCEGAKYPGYLLLQSDNAGPFFLQQRFVLLGRARIEDILSKVYLFPESCSCIRELVRSEVCNYRLVSGKYNVSSDAGTLPAGWEEVQVRTTPQLDDSLICDPFRVCVVEWTPQVLGSCEKNTWSGKVAVVVAVAVAVTVVIGCVGKTRREKQLG